jgi:Transposase, Mutator family
VARQVAGDLPPSYGLEATLTFYRLPRQHRKHLKSTNLLERLNEEIKRRTRVVRIFPDAESYLALIRGARSRCTRTGRTRTATFTGTIGARTRKRPGAWRREAHPIALWATLHVGHNGPASPP